MERQDVPWIARERREAPGSAEKRQGAPGSARGRAPPHVAASRCCRVPGTRQEAFLLDSDRLILPAYGTYTGGLRSSDEALTRIMRAEATAILTGRTPHQIPMPR